MLFYERLVAFVVVAVLCTHHGLHGGGTVVVVAKEVITAVAWDSAGVTTVQVSAAVAASTHIKTATVCSRLPPVHSHGLHGGGALVVIGTET
jgi:hypothetical protein